MTINLMRHVIFLLLLVFSGNLYADQIDGVTIARLKYPGGGDWYLGSSSLPNLIKFIDENTSVAINKNEVRVTLNDNSLYNYPLLYMTGHGNVNLRADDLTNLRNYLEAGGFLLANDSYGMKKAFFREMKKLFPDQAPQEIPFNHSIFNIYYKFPRGLPKIHKHDEKPPQAFGWFVDDKLAVLFIYESDIGDGWEDPLVHKDPPEKRRAALKMGTNILLWALTN